jgi:SAM-dependent methyltransferase
VESASHYGGEDHVAKQAFVERVLAAERPGWVLDVGSNTGTYAVIAALSGAEVVAIDSDMEAVDRLAREAAESGGALAARIQPLCVDLAQPTPGAGWENRESLSFLERAGLERAEGRFDMVMMLAVVHHLLVTSQIPLKEIARLCARLTRRGLLVEWVPAGDPRFQELVRGREALYAGLNEEAFRAAMEMYFEVRGEKRLGNGRVLLHLRRRG